MAEDIIKKLIHGNYEFQIKFLEGQEEIGNDEKIPKYPVLILTCMDPRIDVHRIFQLKPGDVFILRNAGNQYTKDVLRSLLIAIHEYNIDTVIILGHTDCGMTKLDIKVLKDKLMHRSLLEITKDGTYPQMELIKFFRPFVDEFKNVNDQINALKEYSGFPTNIKFVGMLYDVELGWVFEMDKLQEFTYIEEFWNNYETLLKEKHRLLVDLLEPDENTVPETKKRQPSIVKVKQTRDIVAPEADLIENEKEVPTLSVEFPVFNSKILIPKINFPII